MREGGRGMREGGTQRNRWTDGEREGEGREEVNRSKGGREAPPPISAK